MPWYTAKCIFRAVHSGDEPPHDEIGEYRFFLVKEDDEIAARKAVAALGRQREHSYENVHNAVVQWRFDQIQDIKELFAEDIRTGTEVYCEYFSVVPKNK